MDTPETHYTRAGDAEIAYQTFGTGPVDLVWAFGLMTHLEVKWEQPSLADMLGQLSGFSRLILFDRRGCGLSDRGDRHLSPTLDERVQDVLAVLDAVGSPRASLFGVSEGCALAALFATLHPRRTEKLILYGGISRLLRDTAHPWGIFDAEQYEAAFGPVFHHWGTEQGAVAQVRLIAPSAVGDADYISWFARQQRLSLSRDAVVQFMETATRYDISELLPAVKVPTLVLHRSGDSVVPTSSARRIASSIPDARLVELPGVGHLPYIGDAASVVEAMRDFLDVPVPHVLVDHRVVTLLATDAHGQQAAAMVRRYARRWRGTEATTMTGEVVVRFDSATHAVRCALDLVDAAREAEMVLRAAVHTGECEIGGQAVGGSASHVPGALLQHVEPGHVAATATVRDVVPGSGMTFIDERRVLLTGQTEEIFVTTVALEPPADAPTAATGEPEHIFRQDGEYWTLAFEDQVVAVRDSKGMHDLGVLLSDPGRERHVLDLWAGPHHAGRAHEAGRPQEGGVMTTPSGTAQPVIDDEARSRYRRRLVQLDESIGEARLSGGSPERLVEERDWLVHELTAAYGIGGRSRTINDPAERARKAIYRRVTDALRRIEKSHPALGRHLRHSVHTGFYCSYAPERELRWTTNREGSHRPSG